MHGEPSISRVYALGAKNHAQDGIAMFARIEHLRRKAWRLNGVVAVQPSELPQELAAKITAWAVEQYGER